MATGENSAGGVLETRVPATGGENENANSLNGKERKIALQLGPDSTCNQPHLIKLQ